MFVCCLPSQACVVWLDGPSLRGFRLRRLRRRRRRSDGADTASSPVRSFVDLEYLLALSQAVVDSGEEEEEE